MKLIISHLKIDKKSTTKTDMKDKQQLKFSTTPFDVIF